MISKAEGGCLERLLQVLLGPAALYINSSCL